MAMTVGWWVPPNAALESHRPIHTHAPGGAGYTWSPPPVSTMQIHELKDGECRDVLAGSSLGRLACARRDQPYVVPVHFSFDPEQNCIYAFSTIGQKILWMRENPRVCLEVEEVRDKNRWTTVLLFGRYEEIHQDTSEADARRRAEQLFMQRREWWLPAAGKVEGRERPEVVVFRIRIDRLTGRRATRSPD